MFFFQKQTNKKIIYYHDQHLNLLFNEQKYNLILNYLVPSNANKIQMYVCELTYSQTSYRFIQSLNLIIVSNVVCNLQICLHHFDHFHSLLLIFFVAVCYYQNLLLHLQKFSESLSLISAHLKVCVVVWCWCQQHHFLMLHLFLLICFFLFSSFCIFFCGFMRN